MRGGPNQILLERIEAAVSAVDDAFPQSRKRGVGGNRTPVARVGGREDRLAVGRDAGGRGSHFNGDGERPQLGLRRCADGRGERDRRGVQQRRAVRRVYCIAFWTNTQIYT